MREAAMSDKFDPYHQWLGIPASEQPPHHYRLLGISLFEQTPAVIENAADQRMTHLRTFQTGRYSALSQKLLNEMAVAKVCLLNPQKKTAYDQRLRQYLQPSASPAIRPEPNSLESGLEAILKTGGKSTSVTTSAGRRKKSQPDPIVLIGAAMLTVVAIGFAVWVTIGHDSPPSETELAKAGGPATSATPPKHAVPKSLQPSTKEVPISTTTGIPAPTRPKEDPNSASLKSEIPKAPPMAVAETKPEPKANAAVETKPAVQDSPAKQPEPDEKMAPAKKPEPEQEILAKKLIPPSADEQKRLMCDIDEVYKPGEAKDQAAKVALARKLLEDGQKNEANRAEQFVLFRRAGEIARDAGEAGLMLETVDAVVAAGFDIRSYPVKARLLKQLVAQGTPGDSQFSIISATCVKFAEEAAANGAIEEAIDVLDAAKKSVPKWITHGQAALRAAKAASVRAGTAADKAEREGKATAAQVELDAIKSAQPALSDCAKGLKQCGASMRRFRRPASDSRPTPTTRRPAWRSAAGPASARAIGTRVLKLLAKSGDSALKSLAATELASRPSKAEERVARGDAWWDLADKAAGKDKAAMRQRAAYWYREAMVDLPPGLGKLRVEKRLADATVKPTVVDATPKLAKPSQPRSGSLRLRGQVAYDSRAIRSCWRTTSATRSNWRISI